MVDLTSALRAQATALRLINDKGGPILIRKPDGTDYAVNAVRLEAKQKDMTSEVVTVDSVRFMVATSALVTHGIEKLVETGWRIVDGLDNNPPAVDAGSDPLGRIVLVAKVTAGAGLSSLHYLTANFG